MDLLIFIINVLIFIIIMMMTLAPSLVLKIWLIFNKNGHTWEMVHDYEFLFARCKRCNSLSYEKSLCSENKFKRILK